MTSRQIGWLIAGAVVLCIILAPAVGRYLYWLSVYQTAGTVVSTGGALLEGLRKPASEPQKRWVGYPRPQVDIEPGARRRPTARPAAPTRREFDPRLSDPRAPSRLERRERRLDRQERLGRD